jgi:hypothetical protein
MITDLRNQLHQLIEEIEDEEYLSLLKEDVAMYAGEKQVSDELSGEQLKELQEALTEVDKGETISFEDFKKHTAEWIKRLS